MARNIRPRLSSSCPGLGLVLPTLIAMASPGALSAQEFIIHANGDSFKGDGKGFKRGKLEFEIPGGSSS